MDAALARSLQEEEFAIAKQSQVTGDAKVSLFGQLEGCLDKVIKVRYRQSSTNLVK